MTRVLRLASLILAALLLTALGAGGITFAHAQTGEGSVIASESLIQAARFVPGRRIPPPVFMASVCLLAVLLQAVRLGRGRGLPLVRGISTLLIFLLVWELTVYVGLVHTILLPPPTVVLQRLDALWLNDYLEWHLFATFRRFAISFGLALASAFPLGVLVANVPRVFAWLYPIINFARMIPSPAWAPLVILWLGLGDPPAIFIVSIAIFFPIFLNTIRGIGSVLPIYREVIRTLGGTRGDEILQATVPCALPTIFTGIRIGFGLGWVVLATAELIAVDSGLGWLIQVAYTQVDSSGVLAAMTLICWIGVVLDWVLQRVERRLVAW